MVLVAFGVAMVSPAASQATVDNNGTDNSTVTVEVAQKTAIDISPSTLDYNGVNPGSVQVNTSGDEPFNSVEIENIGSTNISHVWFNASMPDSSPFGTGLATNYNAGNFIQIKPTGDLDEKSYSEFTFVNRKEFATSNIPEYIFREDNTWEIGRFRVADQEYFWAVEQQAADGTACATNSDSLRVGNAAHNKTTTGSNDFRNGAGEFSSYQPTDGGDTSDAVVNDVNVSGANYRVDINCNPSNGEVTVTRSRYNIELGENDVADVTNGAAEYVLNQSVSSSSALQPGEHFNVDTRVSIPQGVAQGPVTNGFLRVLVNTQ